MTLVLASVLLCGTISLNAQTGSDRFKTVDEYVQSLGSLDTLNAGTISHLLTKKIS